MKNDLLVGGKIDSSFGKLVKLRRGLPWAAVAATVVGLGGCGVKQAASVADSEVTFEKNPAPQRVEQSENYANLEEALERADRERMIAAAEKNSAGGGGQTNDQKDALARAGGVLPAPASGGSREVLVPNVSSHLSSPVASLSVPGIPSITANGTANSSEGLSTADIVEAVDAPATMPAARSLAPAVRPTAAMGVMNAIALTPAPGSVLQTGPAPVLAEMVPVTSGAVNAGAKISVEDAMGVLRKHVAEHPTLNTALAMALLDGSEGKAPDAAAGNALPAADQKLYADLLAGLSGMSGSAPTASVSDRAAPLVNLAKKWEQAAELTLPRLALASRVDSFGVYTPVEAKFAQGMKHTVIIYCEVANFVTRQEDGGWYETHLSQQETLITEDGLLVWRPNAEEVEDKSMNQRHDFYLVKKLTIPDSLAVGKYTLRMSVTDKNAGSGGKIAIVSLPLEITEK